jgi:hypothetical protein
MMPKMSKRQEVLISKELKSKYISLSAEKLG